MIIPCACSFRPLLSAFNGTVLDSQAVKALNPLNECSDFSMSFVMKLNCFMTTECIAKSVGLPCNEAEMLTRRSGEIALQWLATEISKKNLFANPPMKKSVLWYLVHTSSCLPMHDFFARGLDRTVAHVPHLWSREAMLSVFVMRRWSSFTGLTKAMVVDLESSREFEILSRWCFT